MLMPKSDATKPQEPTGAPELPEESKKLLKGEPHEVAPTEPAATQKQIEKEPEFDKDQMSEATSEEEQPEEFEEATAEEEGKKHRWHRFFKFYGSHKKWTISLTILILLGILFALPWTRYPMLAPFLSKEYSIKLLDNKNGAPVSGATITLDGKSAETDAEGVATLSAKVGERTLAINKKYYKGYSSHVFVGLRTQGSPAEVRLTATGRQVPVTVVNKISNKPIANADIKVLDTKAKTDEEGKAIIVLPTTQPTQDATITASGYNAMTGTVKVTSEVVAGNTFHLTPSGKVYFLSNLSGNIDVVSANLDGSNRKTILAGTGEEEPNNTVLLASRDWKYLALLSKRDGGTYNKLFLINTSNDELKAMDDTVANFAPVGWSDHRFVYHVDHANTKPWQSKNMAIKSYDVDTGSITVLDETAAQGSSQTNYARQSIYPYQVRISDNDIIYTKTWSDAFPDSNLNGKKDQILSSNADGSNKRVLKEFPRSATTGYQFINSNVRKPGDIYFSVYSGSSTVYYEYRDGNVTQSNTITDTAYNRSYPTYLASPSDNRTLWSEPRDGKFTLFIGSPSGENGDQIANLSDYQAYGWFSDNYLLVSKDNSELYIMPASGGTATKIADYYKLQRSYSGYGYGYGGL